MPSVPSRRDFLAAAAAVGASPLLLGTTAKGREPLPVIGSGSHMYEVIHDWGQLPSGTVLGNTHGVVEDAQGHIHVHHTVGKASRNPDTVLVLDGRGRFVRSWGRQFGPGAHGMNIRHEGREEFLYLSDSVHSVVTKRTLKGEEVWTLGYPDESPAYRKSPVPNSATGRNYRPTNVAVAPNGDVYVADGYGAFYVNVYDSSARFKFTFGGPGKEAGKFDTPHGLWIDSRSSTPTLWVADRANSRIQTFALDGRHLGFVDGTKWPCHFHERRGTVVVPDLLGRVTLLDSTNAVIGHLGDLNVSAIGDVIRLRAGVAGSFPAGKFICPHGATFDHDGNIFVVEWVEAGRITKLRRL